MKPKVTMEDFSIILQELKPSVSLAELEKYEVLR